MRITQIESQELMTSLFPIDVGKTDFEGPPVFLQRCLRFKF